LSQNGKEFPRSVDYFIADGKYKSLFEQAYGDKPSTIQVVFPSNDTDLVCRERYEYRDDKGDLVASGDGVNFSVWNGKEYVELCLIDHPNLMSSVGKRYPNRVVKEGKGDGWVVTLTMTFILPAVRGIAGVWQFTTKGTASTIPQITGVFDALVEQRGSVAGVLFDLNVAFAKSSKPGVTSKYPVVTLVPNQSEENVERVRKSIEGNDVLMAGRMLGGQNNG